MESNKSHSKCEGLEIFDMRQKMILINYFFA